MLAEDARDAVVDGADRGQGEVPDEADRRGEPEEKERGGGQEQQMEVRTRLLKREWPLTRCYRRGVAEKGMKWSVYIIFL